MRQVIVSGRSGSGKSTALDVLEDHGFYCIDNLPAGLLPELAERALLHTELLEPQVAVSIDARNLPSQLQRFPELLTEARNRHIKCDVLYLDAEHSVAWDFQDVTASLRRDEDVLTLEAEALPPAEFASRIQIAAQAVVQDDGAGAKFTGEWRISADLDAVDLAVGARLFPPSAVVPQAGRGDVAVPFGQGIGIDHQPSIAQRCRRA